MSNSFHRVKTTYFSSLKEILYLADMSFESDNCLDVVFISSGIGGTPGYLEIIKEKPTGPYQMIEWDCGDPNFIHIYPTGGRHMAGSITKEKFDKVDKSKANVVIGRSLIFDKAYRTYIELMDP